MQKPTLKERLEAVTAQGGVLILDGAMGTLIMRQHLTEDAFRGEEFAGWTVPLKGDNDLLVLTCPDLIRDIHRQYLEAGADLLTTCTFSSQRISQSEYHLSDYAERLCRAGARLAREEADRMTALTPDRPRYVVGDVGPTSRMLSMSEDVENPAARNCTFDELADVFAEQMQWLVEEGVDAILVETIFDTLNAKAAIEAYRRLQAEVPLMLSMTVSDRSARTLSGQTVEAFCATVAYAKPLTIGMNCGMGPEGMLPLLRRMKECVDGDIYLTCHPNAGLPNAMGEYDVTAADLARQMQPLVSEGITQIIGGCCGTTLEHITALCEMSAGTPSNSRRVGENGREGLSLVLTGLDVFRYAPDEFVMVGERCNVAGSRKFLRLINEKQYDEALTIARNQVEKGAMVIDLNMDDGLLDTKEEMCHFLRLMASDPTVSRMPVMIDSSRFDVIEAALKNWQGKAIVNSISLKQGEAEFLRQARIVHRMGAAVVVMCFDEEGQATSYERRIRICQRAYDLLTREVGMVATDIIFDPNILTIATGMAEHANYALDFIRATRWVHENLPGARVSGGLSNLSFAFRGNNPLREAMHSVFLHLAREAGMGMAIMNPATAVDYATIDDELRQALTDVILPKTGDESALERLLQLAEAMKAAATPATPSAPKQQEVLPATESLVAALLAGTTDTLEGDLQQLLADGKTPLDIISGPLMQGMNEVGKRFGEGKMFLPQVVKTARTMKRAVEILSPLIEKEESTKPTGGTILLATVKGDVHDIGKNIVGVVLGCNGFRVIDLGVMVPCEKIVQTAIDDQVDIVCLSGLITPSLDEMCHVAEAMQVAQLHVPLFVGGATTSSIHTAVKIAPLYEGGVFHMRDAAQNPVVAARLLDGTQREATLQANREEQQRIRMAVEQRRLRQETVLQRLQALGGTSAEERRFHQDWTSYQPAVPPFLGEQIQQPIAIRDLVPLIDWLYFYWAWRVKEDSEEGRLLRRDAEAMLAELAADERYAMRATAAFYPAHSENETIVVERRHGAGCPCCGGKAQNVSIPTPRQNLVTLSGQTRQQCLALSDFVSPQPGDHVGAFATTISEAMAARIEALKASGEDDYTMLLLQTISDRLAEAAAEYLSQSFRQASGWGGIRPAVGYPSLPDQQSIFHLSHLLSFAAIGITLTENGAMSPSSSVAGLYIAHPDATYFRLT